MGILREGTHACVSRYTQVSAHKRTCIRMCKGTHVYIFMTFLSSMSGTFCLIGKTCLLLLPNLSSAIAFKF
jgi:hypothetical protein